MKFTDKIIVVTGSTRGIGKAIAQCFARQGALVIILGRNLSMADEVRDNIVKEGFLADSFSCDVSNFQNVQEITDKILDKHKRIDILINNAGITKDKLLLRMTSDDWEDVMSVNLRGVFNMTKVVAKAMLKAKKGKVINISSVIGIVGNAGQSNYAASKAGLIGFTKSIAKELASRSITVNAVAPGFIETDMTSDLNEKTRNEILRQIPLKKIGSASDVAEACVFLASSHADYITGQTLVVDGGFAI